MRRPVAMLAAVWFALRWLAVLPLALGGAIILFQPNRALGLHLAGAGTFALDVATAAACSFFSTAIAIAVAPVQKRWVGAMFGLAWLFAAAFLIGASGSDYLASPREGFTPIAAALILASLAAQAVARADRTAGGGPRLPAALAWIIAALSVPIAAIIATFAVFAAAEAPQDGSALIGVEAGLLSAAGVVAFTAAIAPGRRLALAALVGTFWIVPGLYNTLGGAARDVVTHVVEASTADFHPYPPAAWLQTLFGLASIAGGVLPIAVLLDARRKTPGRTGEA
jgi:hypothetical protein